jgi:hypothetical protein
MYCRSFNGKDNTLLKILRNENLHYCTMAKMLRMFIVRTGKRLEGSVSFVNPKDAAQVFRPQSVSEKNRD